MAGAYASTGIAVEVLVEEHQIASVRVGLKLLQVPKHRAAALLIVKENARHAARQFPSHLPQGHHPFLIQLGTRL